MLGSVPIPKFNVLTWGRRLFQQWCCNAFANVDENVLDWHRTHQDEIRADVYSGMVDAMARDDQADLASMGKPVILNSSYIGGDRHMSKCYQVIFPHIFKVKFINPCLSRMRWPL